MGRGIAGRIGGGRENGDRERRVNELGERGGTRDGWRAGRLNVGAGRMDTWRAAAIQRPAGGCACLSDRRNRLPSMGSEGVGPSDSLQ